MPSLEALRRARTQEEIRDLLERHPELYSDAGLRRMDEMLATLPAVPGLGTAF